MSNNYTEITVTGIICPKCRHFIWSRHRHDYRECPCEYCAIDGGRAYNKISYKASEGLPAPELDTRKVPNDLRLDKIANTLNGK